MVTVPLERAAQQEPLRRRKHKQFIANLFGVRLVGAGVVLLGIVVVCALFANVIAPYDPTAQDYSTVAQGPSAQHLLGTDDLGRDVLSRIVYGSRVSLQVGAIAVSIAVLLGGTLGLLAGYVGGVTDDVIMRFVDAVQAFPGLILALALAAALGPGVGNVMIAVGFISAPAMARLTRGQTLSVREREFVAAAKVMGAPPRTIIARHVWPNVTAPIIVQATLLVATAIVTEASLSFLGVGVQPPTPSWGSMLRTGSQYLEVAPWIALAPGVAIFLTVLAFNVLGDGLRTVLDPRLSSRQRG
jgi:ABC-type dipeptide/oligopeptide/nickel transport system permease subunit